MAGWMIVMGRRIKHTSLRMQVHVLSALPYGQAIQPVRYPWSLVNIGSEVIRKTMRYILEKGRLPGRPRGSGSCTAGRGTRG